jgi:hypothetical protein
MRLLGEVISSPFLNSKTGLDICVTIEWTQCQDRSHDYSPDAHVGTGSVE